MNSSCFHIWNVSHLHASVGSYCKADQSTRPHFPHTPVAGRTLHCGTSSWQQWWGEMPRWHFSRWTYFPDVGHPTRKQWYLQNAEWMNERERLIALSNQKKKAIQTVTRRASFWQPLPGGTYQGAICSSGWVCCVLTANELLLFLLISAQLSAIAVFTYGQTYWAKEGNVLLFQNNVSGVNIKPRGRSGRYTAEGNTEHVEWRILGEQQMLEPLLEK